MNLRTVKNYHVKVTSILIDFKAYKYHISLELSIKIQINI